MATPSRIGIVQEDRSIRSIYCYYDGFPYSNGAVLLNHYTDIEKVKRLIALGDISILEENVEPIQETAIPRYNYESDTITPTTHSFEHPHEKVTIAFHRDRKMEFAQNRYYNEEEFYRHKCGVNYRYLFKDGKWYINRQELTQEIIERSKKAVVNS